MSYIGASDREAILQLVRKEIRASGRDCWLNATEAAKHLKMSRHHFCGSANGVWPARIWHLKSFATMEALGSRRMDETSFRQPKKYLNDEKQSKKQISSSEKGKPDDFNTTATASGADASLVGQIDQLGRDDRQWRGRRFL